MVSIKIKKDANQKISLFSSMMQFSVIKEFPFFINLNGGKNVCLENILINISLSSCKNRQPVFNVDWQSFHMLVILF